MQSELCGSQWAAIPNAVMNSTVKMGERVGVELDKMAIGFSISCSD